MNQPRERSEYGDRQVEAAKRTLVDIGQVLASYGRAIVVVGGWVPDLLIPAATEAHVGSIDVDLLLDTKTLANGGYAEMIQLLLQTKRYRQGNRIFQLIAQVDLRDGEVPVEVEVDFLIPSGAVLTKNHPPLLKDFRALEVDVSDDVFSSTVEMDLKGRSIVGADNTVKVWVATVVDFLLMKANAINRRDKPKDAYDLCYCLEHHSEGIEAIAGQWRARAGEKVLQKAEKVLHGKFSSVSSFGPQQVVQFHDAADQETRDMQARRAYELVQEFLRLASPK